MNELSRKTVLTFASVAFTVVLFLALLALFFSELWSSPENPLGTDGVGPNNRMMDHVKDPDMGVGGKR